MDDDRIQQGNCNSLDDYHVVTAARYYSDIDEKRRNRLDRSSRDDEPAAPELLPYQLILDEAYTHKEDGHLDEAFAILTKPGNRNLPASYYQITRTEHIIGLYYRWQDQLLDRVKAGDQQALTRDAAEYYKSHPPLALAADHFCRAARAAQSMPHPDWALYAELKKLESDACIGVEPRQLQRAFEAVRDALKAWRRLPARNLTKEILFEFKLAENLALRAQIIAKDKASVDGLDHAALMLHQLQDRPDADPDQLANDMLFLEWDWATIYVAQGRYRQAFLSAMKTRRLGRDLLKCVDKVRLQRFIGAILLFCAEEGRQEDYPPKRLLAAASAALDEAYKLLETCEDERGRALTLLADAKLLGLLHEPIDTRVDKLNEAQNIAASLNDDILNAQVDVAWGDEYACQGNKLAARECYTMALQRMTDLGFLELARTARQRIDRLSRRPRKPPPRKPPLKKPDAPDADLSQN